jgi:hypothetical protein
VSNEACEVVFTYIDNDGKKNSKIYQGIYFGSFHEHPFVKQLNCGGESGRMEMISCSITPMKKLKEDVAMKNSELGFKIAEERAREEVQKKSPGEANEKSLNDQT